MRILKFKRIIWSVDILLPDHFVLFQHFSMEKALAFHSIAIIYNRNTTFYFESIVALLKSHFCQVRISLVNTYALEDILTQLHTFNSTHLQKKKSFFFTSSVMSNIRYETNEAIADDISFFKSNIIDKSKI